MRTTPVALCVVALAACAEPVVEGPGPAADGSSSPNDLSPSPASPDLSQGAPPDLALICLDPMDP